MNFYNKSLKRLVVFCLFACFPDESKFRFSCKPSWYRSKTIQYHAEFILTIFKCFTLTEGNTFVILVAAEFASKTFL